METKDYINPADGLLYCEKCRTPRQCKVKAFGAESVQYCICGCERERLAKEKAEREQRQAAADKRRKDHNKFTKVEYLDLFLEADNGITGHITGTISTRKEGKH